MTKILGIETTCDETSVAIVADGTTILSHVISSQIELHRPFGGVVPELASRHHVELISSIYNSCLTQAQCTLSDIDCIAVAKGPGLIGSLLVGMNFAKGLSWSYQKPLIGVNHIEAHLYAALMNQEKPLLPALGVVLSGGHTSLVLIHDIGAYRLIGETIDDAMGEAFDKVAKLLHLPYPGGPELETRALCGNPSRFPFPKGKVKNNPYSFSLSGVKTAVLYAINKLSNLSEEDIADIAASFQNVVFSDLEEKMKRACQEFSPHAIYVGGGVSQNKTLQKRLSERFSIPVIFPKPNMSTDNAAMIAGLGYHLYTKKCESELFSLQPETRIPF